MRRGPGVSNTPRHGDGDGATSSSVGGNALESPSSEEQVGDKTQYAVGLEDPTVRSHHPISVDVGVIVGVVVVGGDGGGGTATTVGNRSLWCGEQR